jgi:hypothetical protein
MTQGAPSAAKPEQFSRPLPWGFSHEKHEEAQASRNEVFLTLAYLKVSEQVTLRA